MDILSIEAGKSTPRVLLDSQTGVLEFMGESYPENAAKFYAPIFEWVENYLAVSGDRETVLNMEIIYFNSSSSKILMNLFEMLEDAAAQGAKITVNWRYNGENETAQECGEEFMEDMENVTFNLIRTC